MIPELRQLARTFHDRHTDTEWHSHSTLQIASIIEGEICIHFPHAVYTVESDDFILIADGHLHRIEGRQGTSQYLGFVALPPHPESFSPSVAAMSGFDWTRSHSTIVRASPQLRECLAEIESFWNTGNAARKLAAQGLLLRLLLRVEEAEAIAINREEYERTSFNDHKMFEQVVRVIERMHTDPCMKATDIADACAVSVSYLYKLFQKNVGYGPKRFLQQYRVNRAIELLGTEDVRISELATRVGFQDIYAFSRLFKRITGRPPSHYRAGAGTKPGKLENEFPLHPARNAGPCSLPQP